jgi:hypothetical protein
MRKIKLFDFHRLVFLGVIIFIVGSFLSSSFADDQKTYGTFMPKIGGIENAVNNYDPNSQIKLIGINIDSDIPLDLYCGEKIDIWVQVTGNYDDQKGNDSKRKIINPVVFIDAPSFLINKGASQGSKVFYTLKAPSAEGINEVKLRVSYEDKTSENVFKIKIINKPGWADKQYVSIYGGSLGIFGADINIYPEEIKTFLNASVYFRKKSEQNERYIMGLEAGPKLFFDLSKKIYIFLGLNIGFDVDSYGGPGFMFGPSDAEIKNYIGPNIGLKIILGQLAIVAQIEQLFYGGNDSVTLIRCGLGI